MTTYRMQKIVAIQNKNYLQDQQNLLFLECCFLAAFTRPNRPMDMRSLFFVHILHGLFPRTCVYFQRMHLYRRQGRVAQSITLCEVTAFLKFPDKHLRASS